MSYNGVGLPTPRGTGTSGYIQRNLSHVRPKDDYRPKGDNFKEERVRHRQPDEEILDHERKRKVEVACMELRVKLEDEEFPEHEVEERISELRATLLAKLMDPNSSFGAPSRADTKALKPSDTHVLGAAKAVESDKMQRALGVKSDYREGDAFDRDLQEKLKQERVEERKKRDEEREEARRERERSYKERRDAGDMQRMREEKERKDFESELRERKSRRERSKGGSSEEQSPPPRRSDHRRPLPRRYASRSPSASPPRVRERYSHGAATRDREISPVAPIKRRRFSSDDTSPSPASPPRRNSSHHARDVSPLRRRERPLSDSTSPSPRKRERSFSDSRSPRPSMQRSEHDLNTSPPTKGSVWTSNDGQDDRSDEVPTGPPGPPPKRPAGLQ